MTTQKSLAERKAEALEAFPELTPLQIAQALLAAAPAVVKVAPPADPVVTVSEIIDILRDEYMEVELGRPRAVIQPDGTMKERDTTTYRTYNTHWKRLQPIHGDVPIQKVTKKMVVDFCNAAQAAAVARHEEANVKREAAGKPLRDRNGAQTFNHALEAFSAVLHYAKEEGLIKKVPLRKVKRKKLKSGNRHGLTPEQIDSIMYVALNGGNDPVLDYILLWTMLETATRIGGLLKLRVGDIDARNQFIEFHQKGDSTHKHPITRALADALLQVAAERGSVRFDEPVFRYHPEGAGRGRPMKAKRFETLWNRIQSELDWAKEEGITSHWYRHTSTTWTDRVASPTVASKWAGHGPSDVTARYTTVKLEELARAHEALFGQPHPSLDWTRK
jgi:integrase